MKTANQLTLKQRLSWLILVDPTSSQRSFKGEEGGRGVRRNDTVRKISQTADGFEDKRDHKPGWPLETPKGNKETDHPLEPSDGNAAWVAP